VNSDASGRLADERVRQVTVMDWKRQAKIIFDVEKPAHFVN